jgi:hypothetical protein
MSQKLLTSILKHINFAERFLSLCPSSNLANRMKTMTPEAVGAILDELGVEWTYNKTENFFKVKETIDGWTVQLNIAFPYGTTEFILFIENKEQKIKAGGPFGRLLKQMDPKIKKSPACVFSDLNQLKQILKEGLAIFNDIKKQVVNVNGN